MTATESLPLFLISVVAISLTGVMMPGPVTAVTIAKGSRHREAGVLVALGHGIVEIPLILLIYFGFAWFLNMQGVKIAVGLAGGMVLLWMALQMFKTRRVPLDERRDIRQGSLVAGLATTASNPYFFLWWATVGAALLASARTFGSAGVIAMGVTHWVCDLAWLYIVSWAVFKSRLLWNERVQGFVFAACAAVLAGFGAWFIFSGIELSL